MGKVGSANAVFVSLKSYLGGAQVLKVISYHKLSPAVISSSASTPLLTLMEIMQKFWPPSWRFLLVLLTRSAYQLLFSSSFCNCFLIFNLHINCFAHFQFAYQIDILIFNLFNQGIFSPSVQHSQHLTQQLVLQRIPEVIFPFLPLVFFLLNTKKILIEIPAMLSNAQ